MDEEILKILKGGFKVFKKFLGIVCVLLLATFPVLAQELEVVSVPVSAVVLSGASFTIDPGTANWTIDLPQSIGEEGEYVPSVEGAQAVYLSYRLPSDRTAQIVCTSAPVLYVGSEFTCAPEVMLQHAFAGEISYPLQALPPVNGGQVVYNGTKSRDYVDATLEIRFFNSDLLLDNGIQEGTYTSIISYTLTEVPR